MLKRKKVSEEFFTLEQATEKADDLNQKMLEKLTKKLKKKTV